jgi:hypothetical protein
MSHQPFAAPIAAIARLDDVTTLDSDGVHIVRLVTTITGIVLTLIVQLAMGARHGASASTPNSAPGVHRATSGPVTEGVASMSSGRHVGNDGA